MKKNIAFMASLFLAGSVFGADGDVLKRLEALEKEVGTLKAENAKLKEGANKALKDDIKKELVVLEDRLDEVETLTLVDKIKLGLGFRQRMDYYEKEYANGDSVVDGNNWSSRLHLNMESKITDDMKFTGRLAMLKYWADGAPNSLGYRDSMQGRRPSDSSLWVERAYVDWKLWDGDVSGTLTLGRQPSSDGPSHEYKDNTVRKSTYSALAFDGAVDGIVATIGLEKATGMENSALRVAYGKAYQAHDTAYPTYSYDGSKIIGMDGSPLKDTEVLGFFLDGTIPSVANTLWQMGYVNAKDLIFNDMTNASGQNENIGDLSIYGLMVEATNIENIGLDLFAHYGISQAKSNGFLVPMPDGSKMGLLVDGSDADMENSGNAVWAGARYTLPVWKKPKIGYEYNRGSQYWFNFNVSPDDYTKKLTTRGSAHEVYNIWEINRYANIRVGAVMIDYEYMGSGDYRGKPYKISELPTSAKAQVTDKLTNYYILFNILY